MATPSYDALSLAQALIRHASVTPEDKGVLPYLANLLEGLGFTCHLLEFTEAGTAPVLNLYARWGTEGRNLCFAGHTDVVPPGDIAAWSVPPFAAEVKNGVLYGRGAEDMKGAIAAWVAAVAELVSDGGVKGSLSFLITNDEEGPAINGTRKVLAWLKERGERLDACLVGEPTNPEVLGEMVKIGRRGSMNSILTVQGVQGHVAYPHLAQNPVTLLLNILQKLKAEPLDAGTDFFPPSNLEIISIDVGNPSTNVIPARAEARWNIRFNDRHTPEALRGWLHECCQQVTPNYSLEIKVTGDAFLTPPGELSALLTDAIRQETGREPVLSTTGGTSDARFIKDVCPVIEFGTTGLTAHKVDECVKVADIQQLAKIYKRFIQGFFA
jgi:succinyl-diaminopimelate desuccinylase